MELDDGITCRRSVRSFLDKPVDRQTIADIIRLGTYAPSACNRQGWRFIVVTQKSVMKAIHQKGGSHLIERAPVGILVLYHRFTTNAYYDDNTESAAACVQNILLAARSRGLGTCWINDLPKKSRLRKLLGIPSRYDIVAYILLGYPAKEPTLKRKYSKIEELISYNRFEAGSEIETRKPRVRSLLKLGRIILGTSKLFGFLNTLPGIRRLAERERQRVTPDHPLD